MYARVYTGHTQPKVKREDSFSDISDCSFPETDILKNTSSCIVLPAFVMFLDLTESGMDVLLSNLIRGISSRYVLCNCISHLLRDMTCYRKLKWKLFTQGYIWSHAKFIVRNRQASFIEVF